MNTSTLDFLNSIEMPTAQIVDLDIDLIEPDPNQPRTQFHPVDGVVDPTVLQELEELADDINANTLLQPIVVREVDNKYRIVAGERRWRAFKLNCERGHPNSNKIPAIIRRDLVAARLRLAQLSENLQRSDLTDLEAAKFIKDTLEQYPELQKQELAKILKKSSQYVSRLLALLDSAWADIVDTGIITYATLLDQFRPLPKNKQEELKARARLEGRSLTSGDIRNAKEEELTLGSDTSVSTTKIPLDPELAHQVQAFVASQAPQGESYQPSAKAMAPHHIKDTGGDAVIPVGTMAINTDIFEKREARLTLHQLETLLMHNVLPNKKHQVSLMLPVKEMKQTITELGGTLPEDERQLPTILIETINRLSR